MSLSTFNCAKYGGMFLHAQTTKNKLGNILYYNIGVYRVWLYVIVYIIILLNYILFLYEASYY